MGIKNNVIAMENWIQTAREAAQRSPIVRDELRAEAKKMLYDGEHDTARRIFVDILEEPVPETNTAVAAGHGKPT